MLQGYIEYYKEPTKIIPMTSGEKKWPKKYVEKLMAKKEKEGWKPGAILRAKVSGLLYTMEGWVSIPEEGYKFTHFEPCLIRAHSNKSNYVSAWRFDELELIDITTGEITC